MQHPYCDTGYVTAEWRPGWVGVSPSCSGGAGSSTGTQYPVLINRATGRCLDSRAHGIPQAGAVLQRWDCTRRATEWNAANPAVAVWQRRLRLIR